jgi:ureidoacrylate peracid hydrolase
MKTALLVIDFINDIVSQNGKIPSCAKQVLEKKVIQKANTAIEFAREKNWLIIPIKVGFSSDYREQPKNSPIFGKANQFQALSLGQWGTEFHPDLNISANDNVIVKHRISPFYGTSLDLVLKNNSITRIVVSGVSSSWAIQSTVRDGHDRDYEMILLEDACAASTEEEHQTALKMCERIAKIIKTNDLSILSNS